MGGYISILKVRSKKLLCWGFTDSSRRRRRCLPNTISIANCWNHRTTAHAVALDAYRPEGISSTTLKQCVAAAVEGGSGQGSPGPAYQSCCGRYQSIKITMRGAISPVFILAFTLLLHVSSSFASDNESPDLLPKAPDALLKNFLASPDSEPGAPLLHRFNPLTRSIFFEISESASCR